MKRSDFFDKKAQQSNWFVIVLVMAIIVLVVVALSVTGAFGKISDLFGKAKDIEIMAQSCGVYASQNLETSYCNTFDEVEINGKKQYANCEYLEEHAEFEGEGSIECGDMTSTIRFFCKNKELKKDEKINALTCGSFMDECSNLVKDSKGVWKPNCEEGQTDMTYFATDKSTDPNEKYCCVSTQALKNS